MAPENTLSAFRLGAAHGYRMFECDVKLSADGVPFLLHDSTLERTTTGHGTAGDHTWHALSQLDAGAWHSPTFAGEALPTLAAVAGACLANGWLLNIEIKPTPGQEARTGQAVALAVRQLWAVTERSASAQGAQTPTAHCSQAEPPFRACPPLLTSFKPEALAAAQASAPELPRGLLLDSLWEGWLDTALRLACVAVVCQHRLWTAEVVAAVHGVGLRALSYTVNDAEAAQRLLDLGTDGLITDRVDLFTP